MGRGTGAVASHGEGEARWGTHDPIPSTRRVMIINPVGTAPFNRTSVGQRRRRLRSASEELRAPLLVFLFHRVHADHTGPPSSISSFSSH